MAYLAWNAVVIGDCANYNEKEVKEMIATLREKHPDHQGLAKRSDGSYIREWAAHALCFRWGIMKEKAREAKLQYDLKPIYGFLYAIFGNIARLILKIFYNKK